MKKYYHTIIVKILICFSLIISTTIEPCGLALVLLRKPLSSYEDPTWGLRKCCLLMEKQRNRGQDGAGLSVGKFAQQHDPEFYRACSAAPNPLENLFATISQDLANFNKSSLVSPKELKQNYSFIGEIYLGHVRYGTYCGSDIRFCQPFIWQHQDHTKQLVLAGNFNLTNTQELLMGLKERGIALPTEADTQVILEYLGSAFANMNSKQTPIPAHPERVYPEPQSKGRVSGAKHGSTIAEIINSVTSQWDGGYVFAGILGTGDIFIFRDPVGIRPAFFYYNQDFFAAASESAALANTFGLNPAQIQEIKPGHIITISPDGVICEQQFTPLLPEKKCSFERIYFSRSHDPAIYEERKALGRNLAQRVFEAINYDTENTVFSYIPNTSEIAFLGLVEELNTLVYKKTITQLQEITRNNTISSQDIKTLKKLSYNRVRAEKIVYKDQLVRTFIAQDNVRLGLASNVYDTTKNIVKPTDTLVVIDDSIVRGTTLRESIIKQLAQLNPKKIIIVSSAPPVLYPDSYGIDMSQIGSFIAFQAAVSLLKEQNKQDLLDSVAQFCQEPHNSLPVNYIKLIYENFTQDMLETKIAQLVRPNNLKWDGEIHIIYQTLDGLHKSIPNHTGDWYFTGDYPTPGGFKVLNTSYLNWYNGITKRAYE